MNKIVKMTMMTVIIISLITAVSIAGPLGHIDQEKKDRDNAKNEETKDKPVKEEQINPEKLKEDIYTVSNSAIELKIEQLDNARKHGDKKLEESILKELEKEFPRNVISHQDIKEPIAIYYDEVTTTPIPTTTPILDPLWTTDILLAGLTGDQVNPVIAVDQRNGIMYTAFEDWRDPSGEVEIYKSTDGGNTWYHRMTIEDATQPSITVADDTILVAFVYNNQYLYVYHEKDGIGTFALVDSSTNGIWGPDITSDAPEYGASWYSYVSYNVFDGTDNKLRNARSTDKSVSYSWIGLLTYPSGYTPGAPSIDAAGGSRVYVTYESLWGSTDRDVKVKISTDFGISFPNVYCIGCSSLAETEPSVAATKNVGANTVVIAYTRDDNTDKDVYYQHSVNGGETWMTPWCLLCSSSTEKSPDLATDISAGKIHAVVNRAYDVIYLSTDYFNPTGWSSSVTINENNYLSSIYSRPSVASNSKRSADNRAVVVWTDFRNIDYDIYFDSAGNILDAFVRGTDNGLWYRQYNGATWGSWTNLGGIINSDPDAVSYNGKTYVFARGTDNALWYRTYDGTWSSWISIGGIINSAPGVAEAEGKLYVFARGTDNALWYRTYDGSWSSWTSLGGIVNSGPGAMRLGYPTSKLFVFARGTDNGLWYRTHDGGWSPWLNLGGTINSDPDSTALGDRIYVFARGTDNAVWYKYYNGAAWSGWTSLGGIINSSPGAVTYGQNAYIFARGSDNALWDRTLGGPWQSLGGIITSGPGVTS